MSKKRAFLGIILCNLLLITACANNQTDNNISNPEEITYTNKYECTRSETLTTSSFYYQTKKEVKNEEDSGKNAVEIVYTRSYDFSKEGSKLLNYYDITTYNFLVDYDMESLKEYFASTCTESDKSTYKNCKVTLKDKTITILKEVDLNSETGKEYLSTSTLDSIKENYEESPYTCK